jgi:hypothetical protein
LEAAVAFFFEVYWFCHGGVVTALSALRAEGNAQIWSASRGSAFPSGAVRQCQVVAPGLRFRVGGGAGDTVRMREAVEQGWKFKASTEVEDQGDRGGRIRCFFESLGTNGGRRKAECAGPVMGPSAISPRDSFWVGAGGAAIVPDLSNPGRF